MCTCACQPTSPLAVIIFTNQSVIGSCICHIAWCTVHFGKCTHVLPVEDAENMSVKLRFISDMFRVHKYKKTQFLIIVEQRYKDVDTKDVSKGLFSGSDFPSILPVALTAFQIFFILRGCVVGTLLKKCGYSLQPTNKARVL